MNYTINPNDLLFSPYNHHSSSPLLPIPLSNHNHHDHHHHHLLDSSPSPQFDFDPESLYAVFLQPNNVDLLPSVEDRSFDAFETIIPMEASKKTMDSQDPTQVSKKRRGKTDRHSKIYTAKGPRDRRMRLSLEVAKEFFGLQDMLGFDKASKTVEWLLTQAKPEIKKLSRSLSQRSNNAFSSDESQTLAFGWVGEKESNMNKGINSTFIDLCEVASTETNEINGKLTKEKKKKKKKSQSRNPIFQKLPKDARVKARERAKERTKEKMKMKMKMRHRSSSEALVYDKKNNEVNEQLGNNSNWSSFETGDDSVQEIEDPSPSNQFVIACNNNMGSNQSLDIINKWTPFAFFNGSTPSIEHQFTDLHQFLEKPRNDFYNSQNNMC